MSTVSVPAAKGLGVVLLEFAVPEFVDVAGGRKNFKTTAKSVGRQTLTKQLGIGSRKKSARKNIPKSLQNNPIGREETFLENFSLIMSSNFRYQLPVAVSGNLGRKVLVIDDVLSSHEQKLYPNTSLDENCIEFEFRTGRT